MEPITFMRLAVIQHDNDYRKFLFQVDREMYDELSQDDYVWCETKKGKKKGKFLFGICCTEEEAKILSQMSMAYWPLAKITGKWTKPVIDSISDIPEHMLKKIRQDAVEEYARKLQDSLNQDKPLPFDMVDDWK